MAYDVNVVATRPTIYPFPSTSTFAIDHCLRVLTDGEGRKMAKRKLLGRASAAPKEELKNPESEKWYVEMRLRHGFSLAA